MNDTNTNAAQVQQDTQRPSERPGYYPGKQDLAADWAEFKSRVEAPAARPPKQGVNRQDETAGHIDLTKLTRAEQDEWNKTGSFPQPKAKPKAEADQERAPGEPRTIREAWQQFKDRVGVPSSEGTQEEAQAEAEADRKNEAESKLSEQVGKPEPAKPETDQPQRQQSPQEASYDRLLERASKTEHFEQIVDRLNTPFFPLSREGVARFQVLGYALGQVPNSADVLYHLAEPENGQIALKLQDAQPHEIAAAVHKISAELRFGGRAAKVGESGAPKPRAPRPPAEVGGRAHFTGDPMLEAVRSNDFKSFEAEMNRQKFRR